MAGENPLLRRFEHAFPLRADGGGPSDPLVAEEVLASALRGEVTNGLEVSLQVAGREPVELLLSAGPILSDAGLPLGCVVSFVDVTERRRAGRERELLLDEAQEARVEAERANRAKDEFLAMLGHELRNPLAPILTALQLMRLRGGSALEHERTVIERQTRHLVRLVDDLLDVSRIARGKIELRKERMDLADAIGKAIEMASPLLEERSHRLEVDVRRGLVLDADPARLAQIVANLVTNAAKYTESGGRISVAAEADGEFLELRVADTGIGIEPDMLARIFEMFTQEPQSLDRARGGLGLGLTIVRNMVDLHGGTVEARSDGRGKGSTFIVRLPAAPAVALSTAMTGSDRAATVATSGPERTTVLVVDDNPDA
ncbi:MAG TPA: HAMP domain-containing sensor histidine kinase, partial [Planctomycetota bacterium]|nr:HAMP domain-containing sensor histidine kinase [Planctomycetota bacterium]